MYTSVSDNIPVGMYNMYMRVQHVLRITDNNKPGGNKVTATIFLFCIHVPPYLLITVFQVTKQMCEIVICGRHITAYINIIRTPDPHHYNIHSSH